MDHLSSSQINLYMQCSLKYKFQYIDELPRLGKPPGLAFGSAVHAALAWFHKEKMAGNGVNLEKLYHIFEADWCCQRMGGKILFEEGDEEERLTVLGRELLGLYFASPKRK